MSKRLPDDRPDADPLPRNLDPRRAGVYAWPRAVKGLDGQAAIARNMVAACGVKSKAVRNPR
jgi:hypothetical protein